MLTSYNKHDIIDLSSKERKLEMDFIQKVAELIIQILTIATMIKVLKKDDKNND
ncbi:hypothetical protein Hs20B_02180 [Lactococcus insecticola]|uniref:Uncharacterized protein n=1 Tax=Pseudolactococcus insecticola TaxID=2709158 RepID=A0A6A0B3C3_9LACT|nr:hypothetical protein Hs20B_02180 [Lactococcus insecticola]